ncbi:MAG: hypothetical protein ACH349_07250 [Candidatus Rhabdochlamydia sp.]
MDWIQTITIIGSMIGATYAFYHITEKRIDKLEENMKRMDDIHREDVQRMDSKWERLFERLLIQDQQKNKS